ncbi:Aldo/keto reductase [Microthyrium microscopicum]|uniref:Aldo/keto reductase n=1 Tax=Microthyrium microscopicum TaxID=703497 RepID=A0A6A6USX5_9PEZI|nr:Aldo/keto reductase [Microthyrium microscopicum]
MTFGEHQKERYGEVTKATAFDILNHFYDNGGNFIDTANTYQHGQSEEWLAEWMINRGNRDEIVLATKYTSPCETHHAKKIQANFGGNGTKSMKIALEASLARLKTTYIDLFYVHWWDYTTTISELMHSLNDLVVAGKVLYLGISDAPAWVVSKANEYARCNGLRQFVVYQGMWNCGMRDFERDIIPMCRAEGMGLCPYGVLGQGRFQTEAGFREREKNPEGRNLIPLSDHDKKISRVLEDIAKAKDVEILNIPLAYVLQKTPYVFPIVGGRKVEHFKGSIAALKVSLSEEDVKKIESAYDFDYGFPHTFLSGTMFDLSTPRNAEGPGDVWLTKALGTFDWVEQPKALRPN